jgi:UDP-glucose:(heptosyl)LPS alpha-1,3-glucosyltransferase
MCRTYPTDVFRVTEQLHTEWLPIMYPRISRLNPRHRGILKLERRALSPENTKHIVTNSCLVKKQVAKNYNFPADRISVVRNGIDRNVFYPSFDYSEKEALRRKNNIPDKAFVMLFAAGNFKIKGLDTALEALRLLPDKIKAHTVLLIAGGDSPLPFRRKIKKLGIEKNTVFIGRRADMRDFYVASDLLLYPSMYEPFANVCLEACACALPVLTTQVNGSSELVSHKKNGYIIKDSGRVKETFEHIQSFFSMSDAERDKFGKAALEASKGYSWEKHAEGLENIFLKILNGKNEN